MSNFITLPDGARVNLDNVEHYYSVEGECLEAKRDVPALSLISYTGGGHLLTTAKVEDIDKLIKEQE